MEKQNISIYFDVAIIYINTSAWLSCMQSNLMQYMTEETLFLIHKLIYKTFKQTKSHIQN